MLWYVTRTTIRLNTIKRNLTALRALQRSHRTHARRQTRTHAHTHARTHAREPTNRQQTCRISSFQVYDNNRSDTMSHRMSHYVAHRYYVASCISKLPIGGRFTYRPLPSWMSHVALRNARCCVPTRCKSNDYLHDCQCNCTTNLIHSDETVVDIARALLAAASL